MSGPVNTRPAEDINQVFETVDFQEVLYVFVVSDVLIVPLMCARAFRYYTRVLLLTYRITLRKHHVNLKLLKIKAWSICKRFQKSLSNI